MSRASLQEIRELPVPEPEETAPPLTEALRAVLDERLDAYLANPDDTLTWPELKARLQQSE